MQLILELLKKIFVALQGAEAQGKLLSSLTRWQTHANAIQASLSSEMAASFANQYATAYEKYVANPVAEKEWYTSSTTESTNPHYSTASTEPIIDFNVVTASRGAVAIGSFNSNTNVPIFLPNAKVCDSMLYKCGTFNSPVYLPSAESLVQAFYSATRFNQPLNLPSARDVRLMMCLCSAYDNIVRLPVCSGAEDAFLNAGMSAENISSTLDSLQTWTDGASHVITFTGCPGASELTQESESVAAATARGWTVEL